MRLFPSRSLQRLVLLHGDGCARLGLDLSAIEGEDDRAVRSWLGERDGRLLAPLAEAWFGRNDWQPFDRTELLAFDPEGCAAAARLWFDECP